MMFSVCNIMMLNILPLFAGRAQVIEATLQKGIIGEWKGLRCYNAANLMLENFNTIVIYSILILVLC